MLERDIENYLVRRVKAMGGEVRKVKWIGRRHAPDRLVMAPGFRLNIRLPNTVGRWTRQAWVEVKKPGEKARAGQLREHARMRALGQHVVVIDSLAGVDQLLGA